MSSKTKSFFLTQQGFLFVFWHLHQWNRVITVDAVEAIFKIVIKDIQNTCFFIKAEHSHSSCCPVEPATWCLWFVYFVSRWQWFVMDLFMAWSAFNTLCSAETASECSYTWSCWSPEKQQHIVKVLWDFIQQQEIISPTIGIFHKQLRRERILRNGRSCKSVLEENSGVVMVHMNLLWWIIRIVPLMVSNKDGMTGFAVMSKWNYV